MPLLHRALIIGVVAAAPTQELPFPGLLEKAAREAGNPLATYAALLAREDAYRASKPFAAIYSEVRFNYEEFLGVPLAGVEAMGLPVFQAKATSGETPIPEGFTPTDAVAAILRAAGRTRLVIYGEEHHLPMTRSLYEPLLRELWKLGYRYLAAETFADEVMAPTFTVPRTTSGYYVADPVFASALRVARSLGYRLVAYDTTERGLPGDGSFRDRTQAQNLKQRIFDRDPQAKVFVIAGRGHAAEVPPADGWTPMASVLKEQTGIDPFTLYAPTMSQRPTREEEDPRYRYATAHDLLRGPTLFVRDDGSCVGSGHCDAYVFWPRITLTNGRPDWMATTLGRKATPIPAALKRGSGLRLVQAFFEGEPDDAVPVDQILVRDGEAWPVLMLPAGEFRVRMVDAKAAVGDAVHVKV